MKVLHLEENHPALIEGLEALGFQNDLAFEDSLEEIMVKKKFNTIFHKLITI